MKKRTIVLSVLLAAAFALSGCKSTLREGMEAIEAANRIEELDLNTVFSEEEGFHAPGIRWGLKLKEIPVVQDYTLQGMVSYGQDGEMTYKAVGLQNRFLGRVNDEATVTVNKNEVGFMVSYLFSADQLEEERKTDPELIGQKALSEQYFQKLTEAFGEPDDVTEHTENIQGLDTKYRTYFWSCETADGKQTQMQWADAYVAGADEPNYVTLGFVWQNSTEDAE